MSGHVSWNGPNVIGDGLDFYIDVSSLNSYNYRFDANSLKDIFNNVSGTFVNAPSYNTNNSGVLTFDGVNDTINMTNSLSYINSSSTGTVEMWIKPIDATPTIIGHPITFADTDAIQFIQLYISTAGRFVADATLSSTTQWNLQTTNPVFSDNTWVHVVLTQDGVEPNIYINGAQPAQSFSVSTNKTRWFNTITGIDNIRLGSLKYNNLADLYFFYGDISSIKLYNRALSGVEVLQNYNTTKNRFGL